MCSGSALEHMLHCKFSEPDLQLAENSRKRFWLVSHFVAQPAQGMPSEVNSLGSLLGCNFLAGFGTHRLGSMARGCV